MNLAIDIGNTLAKLAIIDGGQVVDFLKTEQIDTAYIEKLLKANPGIDAAGQKGDHQHRHAYHHRRQPTPWR